MKDIIITILVIFGIAISVNAQSQVKRIEKTTSFTKQIDVIILEDGRDIEVDYPKNAAMTIDIKSFGSAGNIVTLTLSSNGIEMIEKVFADVAVFYYKSDKQTTYLIKDDMFCYGSIMYTEVDGKMKTIGSFYVKELNYD